jgi:aminoglycoside phosphotransferase (APT) family kinase protein
MPSPDIDSVDFSILVGGGLWQQTYASRKASGKAVYVFQRRGDPRDIRVLRNDCTMDLGAPIDVPKLGPMILHSYIDDPALAGLRKILAQFHSCKILRYRPGKRLTIAASDQQNNAVIVKVLARNADAVFERLTAVAKVQRQLNFTVSRPLQSMRGANYFVQERLPGVPIDVREASFSRSLVQSMATALQSLHRSSASFANTFDMRSQRVRSERYFNLIKTKFPDTERELERLRHKLRSFELQISNRHIPLVPVHGSLHSHQWLRNDQQLALVDFDRAAMGHAELDIATFLAELDYESSHIGTMINREFLAQFDDHDPAILLFYRVHKHVAKAFKASKSARHSVARRKTGRNLMRANALLDNGST